ncbi:hypothetical protein [Nitrincola sp.]|uniref:hypothetical protein n=1 Tax=Nitrincola sp. TaxID=1926584 RepID=UPI003A8D7C5C
MKKIELDVNDDMPVPNIYLLHQGERLLRLKPYPSMLEKIQLSHEQVFALTLAAGAKQSYGPLKGEALENHLEALGYFENAGIDQLKWSDIAKIEPPEVREFIDQLIKSNGE